MSYRSVELSVRTVVHHAEIESRYTVESVPRAVHIEPVEWIDESGVVREHVEPVVVYIKSTNTSHTSEAVIADPYVSSLYDTSVEIIEDRDVLDLYDRSEIVILDVRIVIETCIEAYANVTIAETST